MKKSVRPSVVPRALVLLLALGLTDLVATAALQAQGSIVERNPLMGPILDGGIAPFVFVKLGTLVLAGILLVRQARLDRESVRRACLLGSGLYVASFATAFFLS